MNAFNFFKTSMPATRKADFYLGCLDSSVFMDFDRLENDQIALVRISFDGYGCCRLNEKAELLNQKDSVQFINELNKEPLDQAAITTLVKKIIQLNKAHIWLDALERYALI